MSDPGRRILEVVRHGLGGTRTIPSMILTTFDLDHRLVVSKRGIVQGPFVVRVKQFDDEALEGFRDALHQAIDSGQEIVPVEIDSEGGQVSTLLSMYEELDQARSRGMRIATVACGLAYSAAADLLASGDPGLRFVSTLSRVMIHAGKDGPTEEMPTTNVIATAAESVRMYRQAFELFERNCGKPAGHFQQLLRERDHADWYMSPKEAVNLGIADHVGIPELRVKASLEFEIGIPKGKKKK